MSSIEQAIAALCDPTQSQQVKQQALQVTESAKTDPYFYKLALQKIYEINLDHPYALNFLFWYLQALTEVMAEQYPNFSQPAKQEIQCFLLSVIDSRQNMLNFHMSLLNKFALLYVQVIQHDFPTNWPDAFQELINRAYNSEMHLRLFLAVLKIFQEEHAEEIGSFSQEELRRSNLLKDAVRERVLVHAAEIWKKVMESQNTDLKAATFTVLASYTEWIPLELTLSFTNYMTSMINDEKCQIPVLNCLNALAAKKMSPEKKVELVSNLQLVEFISSFNPENFQQLPPDVPKTVAAVVDTLGSVLTDCGDFERVQTLLGIALKCLVLDDPSISGVVLPFLGKYIHHLRVKEFLEPPQPITELERQNINQICFCTVKRCEFPGYFEHVGPENSDEEDQFYQFRKELADLFKRLLHVEATKEPVLNYLYQHFSDLLSSLEQKSVNQIEAPMFLLFHFGECIQDLSTLLTTQTTYSALVKMIFCSGIKNYSHRIILYQYFEVAVRYGVFFECQEHKPLITNVLEPMLRHINNQDPSVSNHSIYMLFRLCLKASRAIIPHSDVVITAVIDRLDKGVLSSESSKYLFKAIGLIVGCKDMDSQQQANCLSQVIQMVMKTVSVDSINMISEILSGFGSKVRSPVDTQITQLANYIVGSIPSQGLTTDYSKALIFFGQKLVETIEDQASPFLKQLISVLIASSNFETIESVFAVTFI